MAHGGWQQWLSAPSLERFPGRQRRTAPWLSSRYWERCSTSFLRSELRALLAQDGSGSLFNHLVLRQDNNHFAGLLGWNVSIHMAPADNSTVLSRSQRLVWHLSFLNYNSTIQIRFQQRSSFYQKEAELSQGIWGAVATGTESLYNRVVSTSLWRGVPLTGGTIFALQTTFFLPRSSRKWPQNLMASRFRTPTPGLRISNLNFQKRCFLFARLGWDVHPCTGWLW